jgi:hypothetical protein
VIFPGVVKSFTAFSGGPSLGITILKEGKNVILKGIDRRNCKNGGLLFPKSKGIEGQDGRQSSENEPYLLGVKFVQGRKAEELPSKLTRLASFHIYSWGRNTLLYHVTSAHVCFLPLFLIGIPIVLVCFSKFVR